MSAHAVRHLRTTDGHPTAGRTGSGEHGAPGAYLRVLRAGSIRAGDPVVVIERPDHGVTVGGWFQHQDPDDARTLLAAHDDGALALPEKLRRHADRALRRFPA